MSRSKLYSILHSFYDEENGTVIYDDLLLGNTNITTKQLKMHIKNVKCIKSLEFKFPLESEIYVIAGENGSGKSTFIACASTVFYQMLR